MLIKLSPYLIAMSIGLMIGIERERRSVNGRQPMGVRSFLLFALLGAIAGGINETLISLGLVFFAATATLIGYVRTTNSLDDPLHTIGLTTEIAAMATFGLGYFCNREPLLSLALGVIMFVVLLNKPFLHAFTKERLRPEELQAAAILLLISVGVIPLIPNHAIDPLGIFNPRRLGVIIAMIGVIQFVGYAASRMFGNRIGMPLSGFLAGNVSSTAAFMSYPRLAKSLPESYLSVASAASFAITGTLFQLIILMSVISWELVIALAIPLMVIIGFSVVIGIFLSLKNGQPREKESPRNPLSILSAAKLGILLTALIFIVELTERFLGEAFTKIVTFLGALFELHGVAVASANMLENATISLAMAANTVMVAIIASMVSKIGLTIILAEKGPYRRLMLTVTSSLLLLSIGFWFLIRFMPVILLRVS